MRRLDCGEAFVAQRCRHGCWEWRSAWFRERCFPASVLIELEHDELKDEVMMVDRDCIRWNPDMCTFLQSLSW